MFYSTSRTPGTPIMPTVPFTLSLTDFSIVRNARSLENVVLEVGGEFSVGMEIPSTIAIRVRAYIWLGVHRHIGRQGWWVP